MEERAAIAPAGVAVAQLQRGTSAAGHDELHAVADMLIEAESVGTADQPDVMTRARNVGAAAADAGWQASRFVRGPERE
jgi:hypothetical protein